MKTQCSQELINNLKHFKCVSGGMFHGSQNQTRLSMCAGHEEVIRHSVFPQEVHGFMGGGGKM